MSSNNEVERWVSEQRSTEERYANTILLLGYGGFFVLWSTIHDRIPIFLFGLCGLLALISVLLFVMWELLKAFVSGNAINRATRRRDGRRVYPDHQLVEIISIATDRINRFWIWFFAPTVVTGLAAGGILIYSYMRLMF